MNVFLAIMLVMFMFTMVVAMLYCLNTDYSLKSRVFYLVVTLISLTVVLVLFNSMGVLKLW